MPKSDVSFGVYGNSARSGRSPVFIATLITLFVAPALIPLAVIPKALQAIPSDAASYIRETPFDAASYLARAQELAQLPASSMDVIATLRIGQRLAPTDPLMLDAAIRSMLRESNATDAFASIKTLSTVLKGSGHTFAALDEHIGDEVWTQVVGLAVSSKWSGVSGYVEHLCQRDARTGQAMSLRILLAAGGDTPVSQDALLCVERYLLGRGQIDSAYQLRLLFVTQTQRRVDFVFNGDFETPLSGSVFDWTIDSGGEFRDGFAAQIAAAAGSSTKNNALEVRFTGRPIKGVPARQTLVLPPGQYQFTYEALDENFAASAAPGFFLRCIGATDNLLGPADQRQTAGTNWVRRTSNFAVSNRCRGQALTFEPLTRLSGLEGIRGTVYVDKVAISRVK